jgi:hypothetical protein
MGVFMVGYDLNSPGQKYADLGDEIKKLGAWWHHLDSTWLVTSQLIAGDIRTRLKQHLDDGDELLVIDITGANWATAGFSKPATDWLYSSV